MAVRVSLAQKNKSRGLKTWYARVFNPDTRELKYISLGTEKKTEAQALLAEKLAAGEFEKREGEKITVGEALDLFMQKKGQESSPKTALFYEYNLIRPLSVFRSREVQSLTADEILEAIAPEGSEISNGYYNAKFTAVKTFFRFLSLDLDIPVKDPLRRAKKKKKVPKFDKSFWTPEQIDAILNAAPSPSVRLYLSFMAFAGLRLFEARKCTRADIDGRFLSVLGKGGKLARIPVGKRLQMEIERFGPGPWDFSSLRFSLISLRKLAYIAIPEGFNGNANFHRFRHSFGSNLIRGGANVKAVQLLMRHANVQITLNVYSHLLDGDLFEALELIK